jgi:hypothetical protein
MLLPTLQLQGMYSFTTGVTVAGVRCLLVSTLSLSFSCALGTAACQTHPL